MLDHHSIKCGFDGLVQRTPSANGCSIMAEVGHATLKIQRQDQSDFPIGLVCPILQPWDDTLSPDMSGEPPHFIFNCVSPEVDAQSIGMGANPSRILPFWFSQYLWLLILLIFFLNDLSSNIHR
jgi:hypothetical protein